MQVQTETKPYDSINVTPMLDLAYVLLVVFILMTTASVQGLMIQMPRPSNQPATVPHELLVVQVMPDGQLLANGAPVTLAQFERLLATTRQRDAQTSVVIKGDARARYAAVVAVIDLCNQLGVSIGLATGRIGT